ncbi:amidohydrolase family protein [Plantibacter sp. YIM 135347]|uniref:amidohydrolase family protein n=1 Tax=Plantibacter sp. YIM 135347 TaxID=3423919 RepID=UPI003D33EDBE
MTDSTASRAMRVDAHQHFWTPGAFDYPWMEGTALDPVRRPFLPEDLEPALQRNRIDATVLVQTVSDLAETVGFLELARQVPFVAGVVGWVDLTSPAVGETIDELIAEYGPLLVGIRHQVHDEGDENWLERPSVQRGLAALARRGLRFDLLVRTRELPTAVRTVARFPELRFVLDHVAKPRVGTGWDADWSAALAPLSALPNVSVKLSGLVTEAHWDSWNSDTLHPYIARTLELFGAERAMFGSDWPVCLLAAKDYDSVLEALSVNLRLLSGTEREAILGTNAMEFYGLG